MNSDLDLKFSDVVKDNFTLFQNKSKKVSEDYIVSKIYHAIELIYSKEHLPNEEYSELNRSIDVYKKDGIYKGKRISLKNIILNPLKLIDIVLDLILINHDTNYVFLVKLFLNLLNLFVVELMYNDVFVLLQIYKKKVIEYDELYNIIKTASKQEDYDVLSNNQLLISINNLESMDIIKIEDGKIFINEKVKIKY